MGGARRDHSVGPKPRTGARRSGDSEAQFGADALVDVLGHRFGHLDSQAVQVQVVLVPVLGEPFVRGAPGA